MAQEAVCEAVLWTFEALLADNTDKHGNTALFLRMGGLQKVLISMDTHVTSRAVQVGALPRVTCGRGLGIQVV